ncbi:formyltetrahydrofolate deformylase [Nakamurella sp. PAMC28650]|uniref:formyltetrahydrofolate deformylase n=1 Tax=Nakamurella sp. PAMC28650 TaxID=2762325 RepID=UPI00164DA0CF|nr:formyltetrahydrofolate deformylase [Nakamurella sp. PAMC28650]QNK81308.1 formyltetrahydrofolate deformylase [Nakamurella sp. PAMC28650]
MPEPDRRFILTLACPDATGIVAGITTFLAGIGGWIVEAAYHSDPDSQRFFTRQVIRAESLGFDVEELRARFDRVATQLRADRWQVTDSDVRKKAVVLVSREGHCLYELLAQWHSGALNADITAVIGNHPDLGDVASMFGVPFEHIPVPGDPDGKAAAFERIRARVDPHAPDAIVLARFMQVVPPAICAQWAGRLINIHHGFLPSFQGGRPYHQAHTRGVKMVGATCHYVTADLDAGPIIDQDVIRVDHSDSAADMARRGRDIEKAVLARGLAYHLEDRVLLDGLRTIVFD